MEGKAPQIHRQLLSQPEIQDKIDSEIDHVQRDGEGMVGDVMQE